MFWDRKSEPVTGAAVTAVLCEVTPVVVEVKNVPPKKEPIEMEVGVDDLAEYMKVAKELGLEDQPALLEERLGRFLEDEGIHAYDDEAVVKYLNKEFGVGQWEWKGLRKVDAELFSDGNWHQNIGDHQIDFSHRLYAEPVPLPVLLTVKKIADKFPSVNFFISDPKEKEGDPFLLVTNKDMTGFIVERWNEPGFREKTQE
jgi:hypothetical protein